MMSPATSSPPQIASMCRFLVMFSSQFFDNRLTDFEKVDSFENNDSSALFCVVRVSP